ncbi:MAG: DUF1778 domain-containing protein [Thermodesulfobacteriota bacterium]
MRTVNNQNEKPTKKERLEARTTSRVKRLIQRAAELEGRTVTDFMQDSLKKAAENVIRKHEEETLIKLSNADSETFVRTLLNPPAPNKKLKRAARLYKDRTAGK